MPSDLPWMLITLAWPGGREYRDWRSDICFKFRFRSDGIFFCLFFSFFFCLFECEHAKRMRLHFCVTCSPSHFVFRFSILATKSPHHIQQFPLTWIFESSSIWNGHCDIYSFLIEDTHTYTHKTNLLDDNRLRQASRSRYYSLNNTDQLLD